MGILILSQHGRVRWKMKWTLGLYIGLWGGGFRKVGGFLLGVPLTKSIVIGAFIGGLYLGKLQFSVSAHREVIQEIYG